MMNFYSLFKTLIKLSLHHNQSLDHPNFGVSKYVFKNYFKDLYFENEGLVERIFVLCDKERNDTLSWDEFIFTIKLLYTIRLEDKVNLFFNVVEGGSMTFDKLEQICKMSLMRVISDEMEPIINEQAHQFAKFIF